MKNVERTETYGRAKIAVVAFAKNPDVVPVKTRLARTLGDDLSRRIYIGLIEDCLSNLKGIEEAQVYLACYPDDDAAFFKNLAMKYDVELLRQDGADLGERMLRCIKVLLTSHKVAIVFGTDVPLLPVDAIRQALNGLPHWDVIVGPSRDGGYYALGARKVHDLMFDGVEWGTDTVFVATVNNCTAHGLKLAFLAECDDVDDDESLRRLCVSLEHNSQGAESIHALLREQGFLTSKEGKL